MFSHWALGFLLRPIFRRDAVYKWCIFVLIRQVSLLRRHNTLDLISQILRRVLKSVRKFHKKDTCTTLQTVKESKKDFSRYKNIYYISLFRYSCCLLKIRINGMSPFALQYISITAEFLVLFFVLRKMNAIFLNVY